VWRLHVLAPGVRAICAFPEQRLGFDRQAFARDPRIGHRRATDETQTGHR
jgi:hypothetical protein